mgnify:FL=1
MLLKYFIGFEIIISKLAFVLLFGLPPFILNYHIFLKNNRYKKLLIEIKTSFISFLIYLSLTFLLFILSGYINIP